MLVINDFFARQSGTTEYHGPYLRSVQRAVLEVPCCLPLAWFEPAVIISVEENILCHVKTANFGRGRDFGCCILQPVSPFSLDPSLMRAWKGKVPGRSKRIENNPQWVVR
jgi:hypothetical protein